MNPSECDHAAKEGTIRFAEGRLFAECADCGCEDLTATEIDYDYFLDSRGDIVFLNWERWAEA